MGYTLDIKNISIITYKEVLRGQNLLPGRRLLLDNIDDRFQAFTDIGIRNLEELKKLISSPSKIEAFSLKTAVPEEYLIILKREMGSLEQKPLMLSDFPEINHITLAKLSNISIKSTKDIYDLFRSKNMYDRLMSINILGDEIHEIVSLSNLVRINGVGAVAAKLMYESGYTTISEIARAKAHELLKAVLEVNEKKKFYKGKLGDKDMQFVIDFANLMIELGEN